MREEGGSHLALGDARRSCCSALVEELLDVVRPTRSRAWRSRWTVRSGRAGSTSRGRSARSGRRWRRSAPARPARRGRRAPPTSGELAARLRSASDERDQVDRLAALGQLDHAAEDLAVRLAVEVVRREHLDERGRARRCRAGCRRGPTPRPRGSAAEPGGGCRRCSAIAPQRSPSAGAAGVRRACVRLVGGHARASAEPAVRIAGGRRRRIADPARQAHVRGSSPA